MAKRLITVNDILAGHVSLDVACLDRIYLNGYLPTVQVPGQVVQFLQHRGFPIPSPAVVEKMGTRFRDAVKTFAEVNRIPVVRFGKNDRKLSVMQPHLDRQAATGRAGVAAIGVAQEFQRVFTAATGAVRAEGGAPHFSWGKADRRVTAYYFYLWDEDFGPGFIKICAYFPYPIKIWLNGHHWTQRQAAQAGIGVTPLAAGSNSFAGTTDPAGLQAICDRLGPSTITVFAERWWARLPLPLTPADRKAGYWWDLSMRQVEVSRTLVFDRPANGRLFFDALVTDNLDVGRPDQIELIFGRRVLPSTTGVFATRVVTRGVDVTVNALYRHSRVKQYFIISSRSFGVLVLQGVGRRRHVLDAPLAGEAGGHSLALTRWSRRSPSSRATCSCRWVLSVRSRALSSSSVSTRRWRDSSEPRCVAGGRGRLAGACPVRSRSISARRSGCR